MCGQLLYLSVRHATMDCLSCLSCLVSSAKLNLDLNILIRDEWSRGERDI